MSGQTNGLLILAGGFLIFIIMALILRRLGLRALPQDGWSGIEELTVQDIQSAAREIKTVFLQRQEKKPFPVFAPGQFLSLQIGADAKKIRSYSIASSVVSRQSVQIAVKQIASGEGSNWIHSLQVGQRVRAYSPSGQFTDEQLGERPRIYIAGGIGITPILSMIRSHIERGHKFAMTLFYGVRSSADLAFHAELKSYSDQHPHFRYHVMASHDSAFVGDRGFINLTYIHSKTKTDPSAHVFICGPTPMMDTLVADLLSSGFSDEQIHTERFISPVTLTGEKRAPLDAQIKYQGRTLAYRGSRTLLEFLEDQGINHPFACRTGVCGSCKCRIKGKVDQLTDAGLSPRERHDGFILSCVSYPLEDLEILPS